MQGKPATRARQPVGKASRGVGVQHWNPGPLADETTGRFVVAEIVSEIIERPPRSAREFHVLAHRIVRAQQAGRLLRAARADHALFDNQHPVELCLVCRTDERSQHMPVLQIIVVVRTSPICTAFRPVGYTPRKA